MVHFVGAGPGAADLITLRGQRLLKEADCVIYAGSLVNPALLEYTPKECLIFNSAHMTLEEVLSVMEEMEEKGKSTVRLHTGDPSLYGAVKEQIDALRERGIAYDLTPGVSSFSAAAAAVEAQYTLPGVSQSVIITRMEGRTPVPEKEKMKLLASHQTSMVIFLSSSLLEEVTEELLAGGYAPDAPAAIVYKASWPEEKVLSCTVETLATTAKEAHISKTALILVGEFLKADYERSRLYDPTFDTEYREARKP